MVDGTPIIRELQFMASLLYAPKLVMTNIGSKIPNTGDIAKLILKASQLHASSLFGLHKPILEAEFKMEPISSWKSLRAARYCFLYGVLGIHNAVASIASHLFLHLSTLLSDDAESDLTHLTLSQMNPELWIWKKLVAAVSLYRFRPLLVQFHDQCHVEQLEQSARIQIDHWKSMQPKTSWSYGKDVLRRIVWPEIEVAGAESQWNGPSR